MKKVLCVWITQGGDKNTTSAARCGNICKQSPTPIALDEELIKLTIKDRKSEERKNLLKLVKPDYNTFR